MKSRKGFTLVEIIVALAIFTIIVGGSISLILSGSDVFRKSADMSHAARMSQYTIDWLEDELTFATNLRLENDENPLISSYERAIKIGKDGSNKGHLLKYKASNWEEIFTSGFYENLRMWIDVEPDVSGCLSLTVEVINSKNQLIHRVNKRVYFLNIKAFNISEAPEYPVFIYEVP